MRTIDQLRKRDVTLYCIEFSSDTFQFQIPGVSDFLWTKQSNNRAINNENIQRPYSEQDSAEKPSIVLDIIKLTNGEYLNDNDKDIHKEDRSSEARLQNFRKSFGYIGYQSSISIMFNKFYHLKVGLPRQPMVNKKFQQSLTEDK